MKKNDKRIRPKSQSPPPRKRSVREAARRDATFPFVGVGASAGGLAPFLELLRALPAAPGVAVIFILHQEKHESALKEVVARSTPLPVRTIESGLAVEADHVYLGPPAMEVTIRDGKFIVEPRTGGAMIIDLFFRSLSEDQTSRSIAVVLSGSASDGALGTKAIKEEGGITFAQDDTARFREMPHAAISVGSVDFVLPPPEIARELLRMARHAYMAGDAPRLPETEMLSVFEILRASNDIDFTHYKPSTIERRIRRRMALHKIDGLAKYAELLRHDGKEREQLCADVLIRVTSFFRDPEVFTALQQNILPVLTDDRSAENPIRVWVPGCATGEEVYSIAIAVLEATQELGANCPVQIFGTDVSDEAVERARAGIYPESIAGDLTPGRLRRFFTRFEGGYRIAKVVRDCCVFARQNLTKDPPFSRLDMISCRNVMIYLGSVLQRKTLSIFHYALRPNGYLLLGSSETIGNFGELFGIVDRKHKIYQKKTALSRVALQFGHTPPRERVEKPRMEEEVPGPANVYREADRIMLSRYSPPGVLINGSMEILQFRGRTSLFLEPPAGAASFNILKMAREGLLPELRAAIHAARKSEAPVRREGIRVKSNGDATFINLEVIPFDTPSRERYQLVLFEVVPDEQEKGEAGAKSKSNAPDGRQLTRLKRELESTREYLQSIIEEQEAMNEELRSANEEIQSSNEELQSTNEELETAKEELQSSNEELTTLNEELENRNEELAQVNNDLLNLLASVDLPIVMLDSSLRIRRFNQGAQRVLNLIATDVGRSINELKMTLILDDLDQHIIRVIDTLEVREMEVKDRQGHLYSLRIRPYKTMENKIEGVVLVLIDIEQIKKRRPKGKPVSA